MSHYSVKNTKNMYFTSIFFTTCKQKKYVISKFYYVLLDLQSNTKFT